MPPHYNRKYRLQQGGLLLLAALCTAFSNLGAVELENRYEADTSMTKAAPEWQEARKNGGGKVTIEDGKLRVQVSPGKSHYYVIGASGELERGAGSSAYDGSSAEGTTIDFNVAVQAENHEQDVFSLQVGTGTGSCTITFRPGSIVIGKQVIGHDTTEPDTYRIAFKDGRLSLFSANKGELVNLIPILKRYPVNVISLGTRAPLVISTPVSWDLRFIRWSNKGAMFSPPRED